MEKLLIFHVSRLTICKPLKSDFFSGFFIILIGICIIFQLFVIQFIILLKITFLLKSYENLQFCLITTFEIFNHYLARWSFHNVFEVQYDGLTFPQLGYF